MMKNLMNLIIKESGILQSFFNILPDNFYTLFFTEGIDTATFTMTDDGLFFHRFQSWIGEHVAKRYPYAFTDDVYCTNPNRRDTFDESLVKVKQLGSGVYYTIPDKFTLLELRLSYDEKIHKWKFVFTSYGKHASDVIDKINLTWQKMKFSSYKHIIAKNKRISLNECVVYETQNGPRSEWSQTPTVFKEMSEIICPDKEYLLSRVDSFMNSEDIYISKNVPYRLGILLYGPPGTGKTTMALSLSDYIGAYYTINVSLSSLSQIRLWWSGKHNKTINMNEDIRKHSDGRRILFIIEEIDQWFGENDSESYKSEKIRELLQFIDSLDNQAMVVATTNHYDSLSKSLIRAGRFDMKIQMGNFNKESALEFIKILNVDESLLDIVTPDENGNYSPVEIQELAFQMRLLSIHNKLNINNESEA